MSFTHIIGESKYMYKYGQQEQVTVRNHNRRTALERSVLKYWFSTLYTTFSTLYTTLPNNVIKEKLINLIVCTFKREDSPYLACNERQAFFPSGDTKRYKLWSCQNMCEALIYFWMIFTLDLALSYTDKLLVFRWVFIFIFIYKKFSTYSVC